jgi:hypothetical protein
LQHTDGAGCNLELGNSSGSVTFGSTGGHFIVKTGGGVGFADEAETFRVKADGKVGIGTSTPASTLHVQASANALQLNNANEDTFMKVSGDRATFGYRASDGMAIVQGGVGKGIAFGVNNATFGSGEAMRIDSSGNLLIGGTTTTPHTLSAATATVIMPSGGIRIGTYNAPTLQLNRTATDGNAIVIRRDGSTVGGISVTSSATSYNTSSDQRLKENIQDAEDAGSKIDAIKVRQFDWKADGSHQDYGVIAQELIEVAPEAVTEGETEDDMMAVDYSKLVPTLIKEIQTLRNRVAQLENN